VWNATCNECGAPVVAETGAETHDEGVIWVEAGWETEGGGALGW